MVPLLGMMAAVVVSAAVTVATYNVENYTIADRMVEGVYRQAYPKPEKEKAALRHVISDIAPDILALCEMGKPARFKTAVISSRVLYSLSGTSFKVPSSSQFSGSSA